MPVPGNGHAAQDVPSPWVERFAQLIPPGEVLDLACGGGRHARFLAGRGYRVLAVDRDPAALERVAAPLVTPLLADLEGSSDAPANWPFGSGRFTGVVVTNYLHRPLFSHIVASLADEGVLIYETFAQGNEQFGKPSNPAFLLEPGELLSLKNGSSTHRLRVIAFEDGFIASPRPAMVQRICLVKTSSVPSSERLRLF
ncbi:class I SAM-dependent methyltransferase [Noviherbaspirillum saxi]|uniref:class I SAM-dependent methyltransferase n=1 Tax=Noviherbaspirillum saxi TaxID=2320863 RepID=UPI001F2A465D|nr:class I SAM-dependent methyltransferase [Noviherbaspirillum saxi]